MRISKNSRYFEYEIKFEDYYTYDNGYDFEVDDNMAIFNIKLSINNFVYYVEYDYDVKNNCNCGLCIINQKEMSKEDFDKGYLYLDLLNEEFKKHCKYILDCL